jgi:hypothetical protein
MCSVPSVDEVSSAAEFRAKDAPEDEDTRFMRGFPKVTFDELQTQRYCYKHKEHYQHYCVGETSIDIDRLRTKLMKFCPSFQKHCPEMASKLAVNENAQTEMFREAAVPLIVPPALPNAPTFNERMLLDLPVPTGATKASELFPGRPLQTSQLHPNVVRTCTPDCTASHCTTECKCHYSHTVVHARCNPPANAQMASTCQAWYSKCPMFNPVSY